jgi:hypothetical protein
MRPLVKWWRRNGDEALCLFIIGKTGKPIPVQSLFGFC